jgi:hypothetical protein
MEDEAINYPASFFNGFDETDTYGSELVLANKYLSNNQNLILGAPCIYYESGEYIIIRILAYSWRGNGLLLRIANYGKLTLTRRYHIRTKSHVIESYESDRNNRGTHYHHIETMRFYEGSISATATSLCCVYYFDEKLLQAFISNDTVVFNERMDNFNYKNIFPCSVWG